MADWSGVPFHILGVIARKLDFKPDNIQFTAVCSSWRTIGVEERRYVCHQSCPRLVIPGETKESETRNCIESVEGDDGYIIYRPEKNPGKQLSVPHQSYVCGSSLGWLVLIDDKFDMKLFNPLSTQEFDLPSSKTLPPAKPGRRWFCKFYVDRATISVDPTSSTPPQTTVLLIYSGAPHRLAFCRIGDKEWTPIDSPERGSFYENVVGPSHYENVLYYREKFLAIASPGYCDIVDIDRQTVIPYVVKPDSEFGSEPRYLVECEGRLFLVVREVEFDDGSDGDEYVNNENESDMLRRYKTARFRVYRLEEESYERRKWIKVGKCFLCGLYNTPFSLPSTDKLGCKTCKPNSIYFTDDDKPLEYKWDPIRHDIGVYDIYSRKFESVFPAETEVMRPSPFWYYKN